MKFIRVVYIQWRKAAASLGCKLSWLVLISLSCGSFIIEAIETRGAEYTMLKSAAKMWSLNGIGETFHFLYGIYLMFGLPIISVLIFSDEILSVRNNHVTQFILIRTNRLRYYLATVIISFSKCFIMTFFSLILNQFLWIICCPLESNQPITQFVHTDFEGAYLLIFPKLFFNNPYLYNLIYIVMISLLSGLFSLLGVSLCFVVKKQFQVLIIPAIIYLAENFISAAVGHYKFSISETISPFPAVKNLSFKTYIIFSIFILIISIILYVYGAIIKKDEFT